MPALQMVTERDKALRSAVLGTLAVLYQQEGEATVWSQCSRLSDQQKSLIEERFKHASKNPAKAPSQKNKRLEGNGNASEHSEPPSPQPSRVPRCRAFLNPWDHADPCTLQADRYITKDIPPPQDISEPPSPQSARVLPSPHPLT
jgi:hypothetical protein